MAEPLKFFAGKETIKVLKDGKTIDAEISVYKVYLPFLWLIPLFRIGKSYKIHFPEFDATYVGFIPKEYREICKEIGKKF